MNILQNDFNSMNHMLEHYRDKNALFLLDNCEDLLRTEGNMFLKKIEEIVTKTNRDFKIIITTTLDNEISLPTSHVPILVMKLEPLLQ